MADLTDSSCAPGADPLEASMTLVEMEALLRRLVGNPSVGDVPSAEMREYLNMAYKDIQAKYRFHRGRTTCSFATAVGTRRYFLPSNVGVLKRVWNESEDYFIERAGADSLLAHDEHTGKPQYYHRLGRVIDLAPTPDAAYTVHLYYQFMVTSLSADADVPTIPSTWHIGIVYYAEHFYWKFKQDHAKSQLAFNDWKVWVSDKPSEMDEEMRDYSAAVQVPTLGGWKNRAGIRRGRFDFFED